MARIALVTGASRGSGAAIAREPEAADWTVVVNRFDPSEEEADTVVAQIARNGGSAHAAEFDITDVAAVVAFLASDKAGFITGQRIAVNGGRSMP